MGKIKNDHKDSIEILYNLKEKYKDIMSADELKSIDNVIEVVSAIERKKNKYKCITWFCTTDNILNTILENPSDEDDTILELYQKIKFEFKECKEVLKAYIKIGKGNNFAKNHFKKRKNKEDKTN